MLLIAFKVPFLAAAIWIWFITYNEKYAAAAWASATFIIKFSVLGFTTSLPLYGILAFAVAWGVFYGLSLLRNTFWMWPAGLFGFSCMIILS